MTIMLIATVFHIWRVLNQNKHFFSLFWEPTQRTTAGLSPNHFRHKKGKFGWNFTTRFYIKIRKNRCIFCRKFSCFDPKTHLTSFSHSKMITSVRLKLFTYLYNTNIAHKILSMTSVLFSLKNFSSPVIHFRAKFSVFLLLLVKCYVNG